jgi:hypothetical protein
LFSKTRKKINKLKIFFFLSFNLIPLALDKMKGAFGLEAESKMFFPHYFNKAANYGHTLNKLPEKG